MSCRSLLPLCASGPGCFRWAHCACLPRPLRCTLQEAQEAKRARPSPEAHLQPRSNPEASAGAAGPEAAAAAAAAAPDLTSMHQELMCAICQARVALARSFQLAAHSCKPQSAPLRLPPLSAACCRVSLLCALGAGQAGGAHGTAQPRALTSWLCLTAFPIRTACRRCWWPRTTCTRATTPSAGSAWPGGWARASASAPPAGKPRRPPPRMRARILSPHAGLQLLACRHAFWRHSHARN